MAYFLETYLMSATPMEQLISTVNKLQVSSICIITLSNVPYLDLSFLRLSELIVIRTPSPSLAMTH
jgi:hypothetical protein